MEKLFRQNHLINMKVCAIICGGGNCKRMGGGFNKHMFEIRGKPIIQYVLETFQNCESIDEITLTAEPDQIEIYEKLVAENGLDKVKRIVRCGKERQDTVYNGLKATPESDIVVIQDGARPLVTEDMIEKCIEAAKKHGASVIGVPVSDTIKIVNSEMSVVKTPDRKTLWRVQTPQAIRYDLAIKAFDKAYEDGFYGTDDVSLVERLGKNVKIVEGSYDNIKLTTPEDIDVLEKLLEKKLKSN